MLLRIKSFEDWQGKGSGLSRNGRREELHAEAQEAAQELHLREELVSSFYKALSSGKRGRLSADPALLTWPSMRSSQQARLNGQFVADTAERWAARAGATGMLSGGALGAAGDLLGLAAPWLTAEDRGFGDTDKDGDGGLGKLRWKYIWHKGAEQDAHLARIAEPVVEQARQLLAQRVEPAFLERLQKMQPSNVFVNVYEAGEEHGTKKHEDTEPVFGTVTVMLTDSDTEGSPDAAHGLRILGRTDDDVEHELHLRKYEMVAIGPRVRHWVPCVARENSRATMNLFF